MRETRRAAADTIASGLAGLYTLDLVVKVAMLQRFFSRPLPPEPDVWPTVTLLEPITRGARNLSHNLRARARLEYPIPMQRLLLCDETDQESQAICRAVIAEAPAAEARIVPVTSAHMDVAPKLVKLRAGLPHAAGQVIVLMDDDVAPRPDAIAHLVRYLARPDREAVFALPCSADWSTVWSSLMGLFVNSYAILSYVSMITLSEPFRILGQTAAYWRRPLQQVGGFDGLEDYLDDDYVLAQRVRAAGMRAEQVPVVCDVYDGIPSLRRYAAQLKRWMMLPRQAMEPFLTTGQRAAAFFSTSATILFPSVVALLAVATRRRAAASALAIALGAFAGATAACNARYLRGHVPLRRWPLLAAVALITPVQSALSLLGSDQIEWRGQRLRVRRDGHYELVA